MGFGPQSSQSRVLRSILAAGCAVIIFALGLFAVSPNLHEHLHHGSEQMQDDGCAVMQFAGGVSMPLAFAALPVPSAEWREQRYPGWTDVILSSPRYLLQPGHGPPAA
jgi:hypothetical protein